MLRVVIVGYVGAGCAAVTRTVGGYMRVIWGEWKIRWKLQQWGYIGFRVDNHGPHHLNQQEMHITSTHTMSRSLCCSLGLQCGDYGLPSAPSSWPDLGKAAC